MVSLQALILQSRSGFLVVVRRSQRASAIRDSSPQFRWTRGEVNCVHARAERELLIGRLRGELIEATGSMALVDVAGVGYEVSMPQSVMALLPPLGEEVVLLVRQTFREDAVNLYGFLTSFQRRLFDVLLDVKGCGPKVALSLLGSVGEAGIVHAISIEDPRSLARAPGVGPRLAERIILETKDKILEEAALENIERHATKRPAAPDELVDALLGLGYRRSEAEAAAGAARDAASTLPEQIRFATQSLRKQ